MEKNFAIIGCGKIAIRHAEQAEKQGKLMAVCDIIPEKADELARKFNVKAYYSIEELLAGEPAVTVVSICSPNGLHALHSIVSLRSGKNVVCEKPLCLTTADGERMIAEAVQARKKLFVVKSTRYNPIIEAVRQLKENGLLGTLYSLQLNCVWNRPSRYYTDSWRGSLHLDGGTLFTQFSHYIDVLLWVADEEVRELNGFRKNSAHVRQIEFEDNGAVSLLFKNGTLGSIHYSVNAIEKNQEVSLTIIAEKATIKIGGEYLNALHYQQPALVDIAAVLPGNQANDYGFYKGSMGNHDKVYQHIARALDGRESSPVDAGDALKTVSLIERIYSQIPLLP